MQARFPLAAHPRRAPAPSPHAAADWRIRSAMAAQAPVSPRVIWQELTLPVSPAPCGAPAHEEHVAIHVFADVAVLHRLWAGPLVRAGPLGPPGPALRAINKGRSS